MTLQLLRNLSQATLPLTVNDAGAVDQLRLLRAAGLVAVFLSSPHAKAQFARVLVVTPEGRRALSSSEGVAAA